MPDRAAPTQPSVEPLSPELALVDPDLALRARAALPDRGAPAPGDAAASPRGRPAEGVRENRAVPPVESRRVGTPRSAPAHSAPVVLRARASERRRLHWRLAAIVAAAGAGIAGGYVVTGGTLDGDDAGTSLAPVPAAEGSARAGPTVTTVEGVLAAAATPGAARTLLGEPASREPTRDACRIAWPGRGLTIVYASQSARNPCGAGDAIGVLARKRGFASADGLRVGNSLARLRRVYPAAEARPDGWWALSGDRLLAHVDGGRVDTIYATR